MSNTVILVESMRRDGNTDLSAQAFAERARENNSAQIVFVADYKVSHLLIYSFIKQDEVSKTYFLSEIIHQLSYVKSDQCKTEEMAMQIMIANNKSK